MDIRNCRSCGRMFNYISGVPICDACKGELEKKFNEVKEYVRTYGNAPINKVAEDCGVSIRQIKQWVREERLIFSEEVGSFLECENCGTSIRMGRFCMKCKGKLKDELNTAYVAPPTVEVAKKKTSDRMRFLDL